MSHVFAPVVLLALVALFPAPAFAAAPLAGAPARTGAPVKAAPAQLQVPVPGERPDLAVTALAWSAPPKEGDLVGANSTLSVTVKNQGAALAGACQIKFTCTLAGANPAPAELSGLLPCPGLAVNGTVTLKWPVLAGATPWKAGSYTLVAGVDSAGQVAESDESNNARTLTWNIGGKAVGAPSPAQARQVAVTAAAAPALVVPSPAATPAVMGEITGSYGGKGLLDWVGSCGNIKVDIVDQNGVVKRTVAAEPKAAGSCRFRVEIDKPRDYKVVAHSDYQGKATEWMYYQSWVPGTESLNTTNVQLKRAFDTQITPLAPAGGDHKEAGDAIVIKWKGGPPPVSNAMPIEIRRKVVTIAAPGSGDAINDFLSGLANLGDGSGQAPDEGEMIPLTWDPAIPDTAVWQTKTGRLRPEYFRMFPDQSQTLIFRYSYGGQSFEATVSFTLRPASLKVTAPAKDAVVHRGEPVTLQWITMGTAAPATPLKIILGVYSPNGPALRQQPFTTTNGGSYTLTIPADWPGNPNLVSFIGLYNPADTIQSQPIAGVRVKVE